MYRAAPYVLLSLVGAVAAAIVTFVGWYLLAAWLWLPHWRELATWRMYVHDVEATYLVAFSAPFVGALFFGSTLLSVAAIQRTANKPGLVYLINSLPGIVVFLRLNPHILSNAAIGGGWRYPFAECVVLAFGLCWSLALQRLARAGAID